MGVDDRAVHRMTASSDRYPPWRGVETSDVAIAVVPGGFSERGIQD